MTHFAILHHRDFTKGSDIGYGFRMGEIGSDARIENQKTHVLLGLLLDDYVVAGVVDADDAEDAYRVTQNGMPFTASRWASRSTCVGDLLYVGDGTPRLFLVVGVGMVEIEVRDGRLMNYLDRLCAPAT